MTKWYCPLPFRAAFVDSTGVSACCQTYRHRVDLSEWPNHPELKKLQQSLLNGEQPPQCAGCVQQEKIQGRSLRTDSNQDYNNQIFDQTHIDFVDYRSSNICNFKCRSCAPLFSNGIAQEARTHEILNKFYQYHTTTKVVTVTDSNSQWIIDNLLQIRRLMFTGGEPTIIPEVKKIIAAIVSKKIDTISILITSNGSFIDDFWYTLTKTTPNIHWTVSIDAVGPAAEIIRHGTHWEQVEKNVRWLAANANSVDINTVITNLNIFQLKPLLQFAREMQLASIAPKGLHGSDGIRHQFHVVSDPYMLAADNWPDNYRAQAIEYLNDCLTLDLNAEQQTTLEKLIIQLTHHSFNLELWEKQQQYNQALDQIRKENHQVLFGPIYTQ